MQELLDTAANDTTNDLAVVETSLLQLQATLLAIDAVSSAVFEDLANGAAH